MDTEVKKLGRRAKLIVRHPNGTSSVYTGIVVTESLTSFTIKTDRGEERTEPKLYCSVEWLDRGGAHA